jgi:integrase
MSSADAVVPVCMAGYPSSSRKVPRTANVWRLWGIPHKRHTWATLALEGGEHPKVVQERLGHANVSITLNTYSHVSATLHAEAANRVAATIFGPAASDG